MGKFGKIAFFAGSAGAIAILAGIAGALTLGAFYLLMPIWAEQVDEEFRVLSQSGQAQELASQLSNFSVVRGFERDVRATVHDCELVIRTEYDRVCTPELVGSVQAREVVVDLKEMGGDEDDFSFNRHSDAGRDFIHWRLEDGKSRKIQKASLLLSPYGGEISRDGLSGDDWNAAMSAFSEKLMVDLGVYSREVIHSCRLLPHTQTLLAGNVKLKLQPDKSAELLRNLRHHKNKYCK